MSRVNAGGWMRLNCGDPVCRKDDLRHTGRVIKIENSSDVTIKWTTLVSIEPLEDIERTKDAEKIASHRIPNASDKNK